MRKTILSTADVARLFDVTETTVKRWADCGTLKCQKTPGGHRKFEIRFIMEFAETNRFEPVGVLSLPESDGLGPAIQFAVLRRDFPPLVDAFVEKALSREAGTLASFFSYLYEHRIPLCDIYDRVLAPGMGVIGERWSRGEIGVDQEHSATYQSLDAIALLQRLIFTHPPVGKSAICACLDGEAHELGLRCASNIFESAGWTSYYFGARTPHDALIRAIGRLRPNVVTISMTWHQPESPADPHLEEVATASRAVGAQLVLGGKGAPRGTSGESLCDAVLNSSKELLAFIEVSDQRKL